MAHEYTGRKTPTVQVHGEDLVILAYTLGPPAVQWHHELAHQPPGGDHELRASAFGSEHRCGRPRRSLSPIRQPMRTRRHRPQVIRGYWHKPGLGLPGDRIKEQINVSGYTVWPREVEDVLYEHPTVLEAAVAGVPDEYQGEYVAAFVSLKDGYSVRRACAADACNVVPAQTRHSWSMDSSP